MTEFFEPPAPQPPPPRPPRQRTPPWFSAPRGTLPGVVALELVLARTPRAAVCVTRLGAYPQGFGFDLVTMVSDEDDELDPMLFAGRRPWQRRRIAEEGIPEEMLRFGVEFADGAKATNTAGQPLVHQGPGHVETSIAVASSDSPQEPTGPVLQTGGGGGGGGNWRQSVWIWPLPPPGRLTFVCQWPEAGIELTRREIDAQVILDAAGRAQVIFSDADLPDPPA
jgi:hypothetical protein